MQSAVFIESDFLVTDVNECFENISGCAHTCRNTIGGFNCSCNPGYVLGKDLRSCIGKLTSKTIKTKVACV